MLPKPKAELIIYLGSHCGYCHTFKGTQKDGSIDPNSAFEILKRDQELLRAGIRLHAVNTGVKVDALSGVKETRNLSAINALRTPERQIRGVPHFEMSLPGDFINGVKYDGKQGASELKAWALETLSNGSYKARAPAPGPPPPSRKSPVRMMKEAPSQPPAPREPKFIDPARFFIEPNVETEKKEAEKSDTKSMGSISAYAAANDF